MPDTAALRHEPTSRALRLVPRRFPKQPVVAGGLQPNQDILRTSVPDGLEKTAEHERKDKLDMRKNKKNTLEQQCTPTDRRIDETAESWLSVIRSAAQAVMEQMHDPDGLSPILEQLRGRLAEARQQGVSQSEIDGTLEDVRQSYPEVIETWSEILGEITLYVWVEDPDGNRVRGDTVIVDRILWEYDDEGILLEGVAEELHDDLEAQWEVLEPASSGFKESLPSFPFTPEADCSMAKAAAEFFGSCMFHQHRGVWDCGDKIVVFGNDGYQASPRAQREVEVVRDYMEKLDLPSGEFATDKDGFSWAIVVPNYQGLPVDIEELRKKLWEIWGEVSGR